MNWFLARLAEPSTWAGAGLAASQIVAAVHTRDVVSIVGTVAGIVAAVTKG